MRHLPLLLTLLAGFAVLAIGINAMASTSRSISIQQQADKGEVFSQWMLGGSYLKGDGVPQDYAEAAKWYRKAAEQGFAPAQCDLAGMYIEGKGVKKDFTEAEKWYRKAAEQGFVDGQVALGEMYSKGTGVAQDHGEAYLWLNLAVASGKKDAKADRDAAAEKLSPEELAAAQARAREWQPVATTRR